MQADVKAAFLQAYVVDDPLDVDIYMEQVDGFEDPDHPRDEWVCLMVKTLYGMKQSNRLWWRRLVKFMLQYGFEQSAYDPCMFFGERHDRRKTPSYLRGLHYIPILVDDLSSYLNDTSRARKNYAKFIAALDKKYPTDDMGQIEFYLKQAVTADPSRNDYSISQEAHIGKMLEKHDMSRCNPAPLPFENGHMHDILRQGRSAPEDGNDPATDSTEYRSILGGLNFPAVMTRPDIANTVSVLQRFQQNPRHSHLNAARRVQRYL